MRKKVRRTCAIPLRNDIYLGHVIYDGATFQKIPLFFDYICIVMTRKDILVSFCKALLWTLPAVLLALLLFLNPFEHEADFAFSDFYIRTAGRMHKPKLHSDIVIVRADSLGRQEIADVTALADLLGAKTVGLDVFMNGETSLDDEVLATLSSCDHLVLPSSLTGADKASIFSSLPGAAYGYVNLDSRYEDGTIRSFTLFRNGVSSFASVLTGVNTPCSGIIRYDGVEFDVLSPNELTREAVLGKIVLVGNLNDHSDCHLTPIGVLPGVLIHAYTTRTLVDGCTPRGIPIWLIVALSLLTGAVILWLHTLIGGDLANLCSRIGQLVLLFVLYLVGTSLFVSHNLYADFSLPMLMVAAVLLMYDILHGVVELVQRWRKRKQDNS